MGNERWLNIRFGERLKNERDARGWSQPHLVELLEAQGISWHTSTIAKIEGGKRSVRIVEAVALADVFELPLDALLGRAVGPADADLAVALRVLRDDAKRSSDQALDVGREIKQQVRSITSSFEFDGAEELRKLADIACRRLDSAYSAVFEVADQTDDVLRAMTSSTRKSPRKTKAVKA